MNREMQVSDRVLIDAAPETIWAQVADPTQMPRWSPENTGATTPATGRPLTVGERFNGTNRRGRARWVTECVVTVSDPGRRFAFEVRKIGARTPIVRGRSTARSRVARSSRTSSDATSGARSRG